MSCSELLKAVNVTRWSDMVIWHNMCLYSRLIEPKSIDQKNINQYFVQVATLWNSSQIYSSNSIRMNELSENFFKKNAVQSNPLLFRSKEDTYSDFSGQMHRETQLPRPNITDISTAFAFGIRNAIEIANHGRPF